MVYLTSDLHLGHKSICKYRDRFSSSQDHDDFMLSKIESLNKRDVLIILGDFIFDSKQYEEIITRIRKVSCRIKLIYGNHDTLKLLSEDKIEVQCPLLDYKGYWLSHCPIHPEEIRDRKGNIHGHLHQRHLDDKQYINVNIDVNNYEFVSLDLIKEL